MTYGGGSTGSQKTKKKLSFLLKLINSDMFYVYKSSCSLQGNDKSLRFFFLKKTRHILKIFSEKMTNPRDFVLNKNQINFQR